MTPERRRVHATVSGLVQGVGFRPFIHELARAFQLDGWVLNTPAGVELEVEGAPERLGEFVERVRCSSPRPARVDRLEVRELPAAGLAGFEILRSVEAGERRALVLPDQATCADCLAEVFDPLERRHRYPFTNCTRCGPRYSIVRALPYDRERTAMAEFPMCAACRAEFENPGDRRFHAQPIACPACGPTLSFHAGKRSARGEEALGRALAALKDGAIVAVKGVGGFQLLVDARDEDAVRRLRRRKQREAKPLAVLFARVEDVRRECDVSAAEETALTGPAAPIVLLDHRPGAGVLAASVAPGFHRTGAMLPASPLHHLIARDAGFPLVCTSGNASEEPIEYDDARARERLGSIADAFLTHDRAIVRPLDDSVVRVVLGRELILRRSRGYAPAAVDLPDAAEPVLALGGHLKATVTVAARGKAFLSQHLGDLDGVEARRAFEAATGALEELVGAPPARFVCDLHPDYASTRAAEERVRTPVRVQHHHAHVASCMADNGLDGTVLGVSWDGAGLGDDGTLWGGEFLLASRARYRRAAHLAPFPLPGGDQAARDPRRAAVGLLVATGLTDHAGPTVRALRARCARDWRALVTLAESPRTPVTSSAGRVFDAVAALCGLADRNAFEGYAAMRLEEAAAGQEGWPPYPFAIGSGPCRPIDLTPLMWSVVEDLDRGRPAAVVAGRFHETLAAMIVGVARLVPAPGVVLTGGCFQNGLLTRRAAIRLCESGFTPWWHRQVPPNDGGLSLGQAAVVAARREDER